MGIFDKIKSAFKPKVDENSPVNKPLEWFTSEIGRRSFEEYKSYYREMSDYLDEIEDFTEAYELIKKICQDENARVSDDFYIYSKVKSNRWPCIYVYWYLNAYLKSINNYDANVFLFSLFNASFNCKDDRIYKYYGYYAVWALCDLACDNLIEQKNIVNQKIKEISFPDKFTAEYNPIINYLVKQSEFNQKNGVFDGFFQDMPKDSSHSIIYYRVIEMLYVVKVLSDKGEDASEEEWMYEKELLVEGKYNVKLRSEENIIAEMCSRAKYPDIMDQILNSDDDSEEDSGDDPTDIFSAIDRGN